MDTFHIKRTFTPLYNPRTNTRAHWMIGRLSKEFIYAVFVYNSTVDRFIYAVFVYNSTVNRFAGLSPLEAVTGQKPRLP